MAPGWGLSHPNICRDVDQGLKPGGVWCPLQSNMRRGGEGAAHPGGSLPAPVGLRGYSDTFEI